MSDNVPLQIQQEIIKWLPLKPLLKFRSVSKPWKSIIDSSKFINEYHVTHKHSHRLLLRYGKESEIKFRSIVDDDTFPKNKPLVRVPDCIKQLTNPFHVISSSNGVFFMPGYFPKIGLDSQMAVLWNPFLRKTVRIAVPRVSKNKVSDNSTLSCYNLRSGYSVIAFGVCPETNDVKLLLVNSSIPTRWVVKVFTLSSRAWRSLSFDPPFKSCDLTWDQVYLNGFIYLRGLDALKSTPGIKSNLMASFDLKTEMFGQVRLPDIIVHSQYMGLFKQNECLGVVEYSLERGIGVWMIKDATTKSFTKIFTVKPASSVRKVLLGFRKNGQAILGTLADRDRDDDDTDKSSILEVYDPRSGRINDTGIGGIESPYSVSSYISTLLLIDQSDSIIH